MKCKKTTIVFSFASEDRAVAESIARQLDRLKIDYYLYGDHQGQQWGKSLKEILKSNYSGPNKYVVWLLSEAYLKKPDTREELQLANAYHSVRKKEFLLPLLLNEGLSVDELPADMVFMNWEDDAEKVARLIHDKLQPERRRCAIWKLTGALLLLAGLLVGAWKFYDSKDDSKDDSSLVPVNTISEMSIIVQDKAYAQPVSEALVSIPGGLAVETDNTGSVILTLNPPVNVKSTVTLFIQHPSFGTAKETVSAVESGIGNPYILQVEGSGSVSIAGIVRDAISKEPLEGMEVSFLSDILREGTAMVAMTNRFGTYQLTVPKTRLVRELQYVELVVQDPSKKYGSFKNPTNISAPGNIELVKMEKTEVITQELEAVRRTPTEIHIKDLNMSSKIYLKASGQILIGPWVGSTGPNGREGGVLGLSLAEYTIAPEFNGGAVLYRLKGEKRWRLCGEGTEFKPKITGDVTLEFFPNDKDVSNNGGFFDLEVKVER